MYRYSKGYTKYIQTEMSIDCLQSLRKIWRISDLDFTKMLSVRPTISPVGHTNIALLFDNQCSMVDFVSPKIINIRRF